MPRTAQLTPMLRHYLEVKAEHSDAILLYRMGDFFEAFFEDAQRAAPILEVALTSRQKGSESEAPMCGVPHHAVDTYIGKLLTAGLKVAICDQVEDPAKAKGLVKREVTRVITPGTVSDPSLLDTKEANLLAGIAWDGNHGAGAFIDVSTGQFYVRRWDTAADCIEDLTLLAPREVLYLRESLPAVVERWVATQSPCPTALDEEDWYRTTRASDLLQRHFETSTLRGFGMRDKEPAIDAAATALAYVRETQRRELSHIRRLVVRDADDHLVLDSVTLRNLDVFDSSRGQAGRGTLIAVLDRTVTAVGGRLLRDWLQRPLIDPEAVGERQEAVAEWVADRSRRGRVRELLKSQADVERLLARAVLGTLAPREAGALRDSLLAMPELLGELQPLLSPLHVALRGVETAEDLGLRLAAELLPEPAAGLRDGGVIADGVDAELDECRQLARDSKQHILAMQAEERDKTGIGSLKIRFNRVFGYYLEVTKKYEDLVPETWVRKQTLANAERFITPELKGLEEKILTAEGRQVELEMEMFARLQEAIAEESERLIGVARAVGTLDVLVTLAEVAVHGNYVRPEVVEAGEPIQITEGRHPVVEQFATGEFVPNDTELDNTSTLLVLTGPNMGGKSTYLRQVALIVLMAQMGGFVPARKAHIGVVDRIFTRVGASDDLTRGESTFMVEMIETANILHQASPRSLVVLDEVGRGTATFDGLSLAWAIVEYLHEHQCPKTIFATHYHELTELATLLPRVKNYTMAVKEWEERIVFLRRVVPGSADKSYGLHVARLAGIPSSVVERASEILGNLEAEEYDLKGKPKRARGSVPPGARSTADQLRLFAPPEEVATSILREVDVERLTPMAALNLLHSLVTRLRG